MERILKNGKIIAYKEKVYLPNGRTETFRDKSKTAVKQWKERRIAEIRQQKVVGVVPLKEILFSNLFNLWIENKIKLKKRYRTYQNYQSDVKVHLIPYLGKTKVSGINRIHADEIVRRMRSDNYSPRTINKILDRFKQLMNFAVDEGYLLTSPIRKYEEVEEKPRPDCFLTDAEVNQLLRENLNEEIYPIIVLALNTGMRLGEIAGLCWDRVNFQTNQIEVSRTLIREGLTETTKTGVKRNVPINSESRRVLDYVLRKQIHPKFVFVRYSQITKSFEPWDINHISQRAFHTALKRAGIERKIRFHDLRHTFASHWMMNNGNIFDLQKILGHKDLETTQRYAHLSPLHLNKVAETVSFGIKLETTSPFLALCREEGQIS